MRSILPRILLATLSPLPCLAQGSEGTQGPGGPEGESPTAEQLIADFADTIRFGALLRMSLDHSGDEIYSADGEDTSAVRFQDAQLWLAAQPGPFDLFVMAKAADSSGWPPLDQGNLDSFDLRAAWVRAEVAEGLNFYAGQFKCPLVASANVDYDSLILIDRTRIGQLFSMAGAYQPGLAWTYDSDAVHLKLAVQNGADGIVDEYGVVLRGEYRIGEGAAWREGALGAEGFDATFGIGYFTDGSDIGGEDFGSALAFDCYATLDNFSFHGEVLDMDEELAMRAVAAAPGDDATPYSLTFGYRFDELWEAAVRWQDLDNELDTTVITGGINRYIAGHPIKAQLNVSNYDEDGEDGTLVQLGLTVGVGGQRP